MSRDRKHLSIFASLFLFFLACACPGAEAAMTLDASPVQGGGSLRFSRVSPQSLSTTQEVRIRVNSDEGEQYQIFQTMIQPLVSDRGELLDPAAFESYAITGSNAMGSLYHQQVTAVKSIDDLLYSSNTAGQSDALTMAYSVNPAAANASGRFSGKILYTLRPVSGGSQKQVYLDVFLDIDQDFTIETQADHGRALVELHPQDPQGQEGYFKISFSGNAREKIDVYQDFDRLPATEAGVEIGKDVLRFFVTASPEAKVPYGTPADLSRRMLVYSSSLSSDEIVVHFLLNEEALAQLKAGAYHGQIKYILEKASGPATILLNVDIVVEPIFELKVSFPAGEPRFANLIANDPPQVREALVEIKTNLGKPYMVIQRIPSPLANEKGVEFKAEFFDMKVENVEGVGKNSFSAFKTVPREEETLFFSNSKGDPCTAKVFYRLKPYPAMEPGSYLMSIVFSLGET